MYRLRVSGWSDYAQRRVNVTLRYDQSGKLLNPRSVAMSQQVGWGEIQQSRKLHSRFGDVWWVSTAGHGGAILVTQKRYPELEGLYEPAFKIEAQFPEGPRVETYAYEFEEDTAWAYLAYVDDEFQKAFTAWRNSWPHVVANNLQLTPEQDRREYTIPTMIHWHKNLLRNHENDFCLLPDDYYASVLLSQRRHNSAQ